MQGDELDEDEEEDLEDDGTDFKEKPMPEEDENDALVQQGSNVSWVDSAGWSVQGPCTSITRYGKSCARSPGYPRYYRNNQACTLIAPPGPLEVISFSTQRRFDKLCVNGVGYSGHFYNRPKNVVPTGEIRWRSDFS